MCGSPVLELLSNVKTIHLDFLDAEIMQMRHEHILAKVLCLPQEFRKTGFNSESEQDSGMAQSLVNLVRTKSQKAFSTITITDKPQQY